MKRAIRRHWVSFLAILFCVASAIRYLWDGNTPAFQFAMHAAVVWCLLVIMEERLRA